MQQQVRTLTLGLPNGSVYEIPAEGIDQILPSVVLHPDALASLPANLPDEERLPYLAGLAAVAAVTHWEKLFNAVRQPDYASARLSVEQQKHLDESMQLFDPEVTLAEFVETVVGQFASLQMMLARRQAAGAGSSCAEVYDHVLFYGNCPALARTFAEYAMLRVKHAPGEIAESLAVGMMTEINLAMNNLKSKVC